MTGYGDKALACFLVSGLIAFGGLENEQQVIWLTQALTFVFGLIGGVLHWKVLSEKTKVLDTQDVGTLGVGMTFSAVLAITGLEHDAILNNEHVVTLILGAATAVTHSGMRRD